MAMSMPDVQVGAIVEWYHHVDDKTGKTKLRNPIRRGVIERIETETETTEIWVRFRPEGGAEKVPAAEMNLVSGPTKESLRIVRPTFENPNELMERENRAAKPRPAVENALKLTPAGRKGGVVQ